MARNHPLRAHERRLGLDHCHRRVSARVTLFDRLFDAKLFCAAGFRSHASIIAAVAARARLSFD
jgi:hypothetical protein